MPAGEGAAPHRMVLRRIVVVAAVLAAGCGRGQDPALIGVAATGATSTLTTATTAPVTSLPSTTTPTSSPPAAPAETAATTAPAPVPIPQPAVVPPRAAVETAFAPYAVVGPVVLVHPGAVVERVALHESNHDGAQHQDALATAANAVALETRDRGTDPQSAADIVVEPTTEIRAPVTGTVIRGGTYTLYCDHVDEYVVIEPDDRPGWEVKVLHFVGLRVARGERVEAGVTVLGDHARQLPFPSQVDELAPPHPPWPHIHVEVVDPSIPDRPGEGC